MGEEVGSDTRNVHTLPINPKIGSDIICHKFCELDESTFCPSILLFHPVHIDSDRIKHSIESEHVSYSLVIVHLRKSTNISPLSNTLMDKLV